MSATELEYKIEPTDKAFIGYDNQYSQEDYLPGAVPLNLQNSQTVDSLQQHIVDILPPTDVVPEVAAYQQVRTENAFNTDKYSSSESYMLGDSGYDEQIMTGFSDHCHDYSQQSCSGCPNPSSSSYSLEQSEEEYRHYVQDPRNDTYAYSSVMQNNGEYTNYYRNSEGQEYKYDFAAYGEHEPRKRRTLDNDSLRVRASSNCQLNPTAVAIMDAWYRKHLDRPYPNKEEKMSMAIAGSITETQVGSWFANRRNRSNNTRPKQNMKRLKSAISALCMEYQARCNGLINGSELQGRILALIEQHMKV